MTPDLADIYDTHSKALFAFLLNFTRSEADACDVMQDVFLKIAERPSLAGGARDLRPWLIQMAHRKALDMFRRKATRERVVLAASAEVPIFAPCDEGDEFHAAVSRALVELPEEQRAVVHLKIWEDMTFAQIAETLGIRANTAASRYRYGLDKLESLLRPIQNEHQP